LNDINIQRQFEGHFLLSNTSGEVAQHFNRVAHLTEIDKGLSNIRSLIDSIQRKIKSTEEDIKVKKIKLQSFDYLPRFEQEVEKLENLQIQTTRKEQQLNSLTLLLDSIFNVEEELEEESKILTLEPEINKIISFIQSRDETTTRIIKLRNLIEQIEDLEIDIKSYERILSTESLVNNISNWIEKQNKLDKSIRTLGNLVKNIESTETELINIEERIRNLEKQFHELMPDICPLCGSNLKKR